MPKNSKCSRHTQGQLLLNIIVGHGHLACFRTANAKEHWIGRSRHLEVVEVSCRSYTGQIEQIEGHAETASGLDPVPLMLLW